MAEAAKQRRYTTNIAGFPVPYDEPTPEEIQAQEADRKMKADMEVQSVASPEEKKNVADTVNTHLDAIDSLFADDPENADIAKQLKELVVHEGQTNLTEAAKTRQVSGNMASSIAQIPSDTVMTLDFARAGIKGVIEAIAPDEKDIKKGYSKRLAQKFNEEMFVEGGLDNVQKKLTDVIDQVKQQHPNATAAQIEKIVTKYAKGDDFYEFTVSQMTPGFRLGMTVNNYANQLFGLNKRPDQQTQSDDLIQAFTQALIPSSLITGPIDYATAKAFAAATKNGHKSILSESIRYARKAAASKAGRVAEVFLPGTSPYTRGNVAANAAVGGAMVEGMRYAMNLPNIIGEMKDMPISMDPAKSLDEQPVPMKTPENLAPDVSNGEPPHGHGVNIEAQIDQDVAMGGLSVGAVFGIPGIRRALVQNARNVIRQATGAATAPVPPPPVGAAHQAATAGAQAAQQAGPTVAQRVSAANTANAGPSRAAQTAAAGHTMTPTLSRFTGLADINSPAKHVVNKYKPIGDTTSVDMVDYLMSSGTNIKRQEAYVNLHSHGKLPNHPDTIPLAHVEQRFNALSPDGQELFTKYLYAMQVNQDVAKNLSELQVEARQAYNTYRMATLANNGRKARAALKQYQDANAKITNIQTDAPSSRPSMVGWSEPMRNQMIRDAQARPDVMSVVNDWNRYNRDVLGANVANGYMSTADAVELITNRPTYVLLKERAHADLEPGTLKRKAVLFGDRLANAAGIPTEGFKERYFTPEYARNITGEGINVNRPMHPIAAARLYSQRMIGDIVSNNARRDVIDQLKSYPGALGTVLKPFEFSGGNRTITQVSKAQFANPNAGFRAQVDTHNARAGGNNLVRVVRDGKVEYWQFADRSLSDSLQFHPTFAVPILNMARKGQQIGTTGWAQLGFAPLAALRDVAVARTTRPVEYSMGSVDTWGRMLFKYLGANPKGVDAAFSVLPDPTAYVLNPLKGVTYKVAYDAMEAAAQKIEKDLRLGSGVLNTLVTQFPQSRALIVNSGRYMQKVFDDSAYKLFKYRAITSPSLFADGSKIIDDYNVEAAGKVSHVYAATIGTMKYLAESLQNSTRISFIAENFRPNMTAAEVNKLVHATNQLTADLSRTSGSKIVQGITSIIPFSNATLQGTRHLYNASMPSSVAKAANKVGANLIDKRVDDFWTRLAVDVGLPVMVSAAFMQDWEGAADWWYNQVPDWKRATNIPFPNYKALEHYYENGEMPPFHPDYVNQWPLAPDFILHKSAFTAGLRALGLIGPDKQTQPYSALAEVGQGIKMYTSFMMPSVVSAPGALLGYNLTPDGITQIQNPAFQGGNPDMIDFNSVIPQTVSDVVNSVWGTAGKMVVTAVNQGLESYDKYENLSKAIYDMGRTAIHETKKHAPEIDIPVLFDAAKRYYTSNPEGEYVHGTEKALEPVTGQHSVETNEFTPMIAELLGNEPPDKIGDPFLKGVATYVYDMMSKSGEYKAASDAYSEMRKQISILDANRTRFRSSRQYQTERNKMIIVQQNLQKQKSQLLYDTERKMQQVFGQQFEQQYGTTFTYEHLGELVRADVRSQK